MLVDLHIHSYYSDGTMSPKEIVKEAKNKNLGVISITDHNVLDYIFSTNINIFLYLYLSLFIKVIFLFSFLLI